MQVLEPWPQPLVNVVWSEGGASVVSRIEKVDVLMNFVPSKPVEITQYQLVFRLEDGCGSAYRFECDEQGNVIQDRLRELALHNLRLCRTGEIDGYLVRPGVVTSYTQSYIKDGSGTCVCGAHVTLHSSWANACDCGREYNGSGQLLADCSLWGEGGVMEAEPTPLFEKPEATRERVALADIKPWSTGGAKSANTKSIAALGLHGEVMLEQLAPRRSARRD